MLRTGEGGVAPWARDGLPPSGEAWGRVGEGGAPVTHERRLFARSLRLAATDAERKLWGRLRGRQLAGAYFRRQHPVGPYVADLLCAALKLVVEVDGGQHVGSDRDAKRDAWFAAQGYLVLRFWNNEVLRDTDAVAAKVHLTILELQAAKRATE